MPDRRPSKQDVLNASARIFLNDVTSAIDGALAKHLDSTELADSIETIASDIVSEVVGVIEGSGHDDGYHLIPQEPDLALLPATKVEYEEVMNGVENPSGVSITESLRRMFEELQE